MSIENFFLTLAVFIGAACLLLFSAEPSILEPLHPKRLFEELVWFLNELAQQRRQQRRLARALHASNAWHCGCARCITERLHLHGDVARKNILGVTVERYVATEEELKTLRGPR